MSAVVGSQFGRLTVISIHKCGTGNRATVICSCGVSKDVLIGNLRAGRTKSCGCGLRDNKPNLRHGMSNTGEHNAWRSAKGRCTNRSNSAYPRYGGRGIQMSPEWLASFETFLADMGPRPAGTTLDRIDNNGPYSRKNCRWATPKAQANNRRSNVLLTANGITASISWWSERTGIAYDVIKQRVRKLGWTAERAVRVEVAA